MQKELKEFYNSLRTRDSNGQFSDDFNEILGDFVFCSKCYTSFDMFSFGRTVRPEDIFSLWKKSADPNCKRCFGTGYNRLAIGESDDN